MPGSELQVYKPATDKDVAVSTEVGLYKINSSREVAVSTEVRLSKAMWSCPRGVKVQLLGAGGCLVYGTYNGDSFWTQWAPLPGKALDD